MWSVPLGLTKLKAGNDLGIRSRHRSKYIPPILQRLVLHLFTLWMHVRKGITTDSGLTNGLPPQSSQLGVWFQQSFFNAIGSRGGLCLLKQSRWEILTFGENQVQHSNCTPRALSPWKRVAKKYLGAATTWVSCSLMRPDQGRRINPGNGDRLFGFCWSHEESDCSSKTRWSLFSYHYMSLFKKEEKNGNGRPDSHLTSVSKTP